MAETNGEGGSNGDVVLSVVDLSVAETAELDLEGMGGDEVLTLEGGDDDYEVVETPREGVDSVEAQRALAKAQLKVSLIAHGVFEPLKMRESAREVIEVARAAGADARELALLEDDLQVNTVKGLLARAERAVSVFKKGTSGPVFIKSTAEKAIEAVRNESDDPGILQALQDLEQELEEATSDVFFRHAEVLVVKLENADKPGNRRILEETAQDAIELARGNGADPSALQTLITRIDEVMSDPLANDNDGDSFIF